MTDIQRRATKYTTELQTILQHLGHATNAQIAYELRKNYPDVSCTTVHRVTQRLAADGQIGMAPQAEDGSVRYDNNTKPHDHFLCTNCHKLRDINTPGNCRKLLQQELGGCTIEGSLTVSGVCPNCNNPQNNQ